MKKHSGFISFKIKIESISKQKSSDMRVLIVEDETAAYENLVDILKEVSYDIQISGNTESVTQTIHWLQSNPAPDLIFMDIHLSDGSAFTIFDKMELKPHCFYDGL